MSFCSGSSAEFGSVQQGWSRTALSSMHMQARPEKEAWPSVRGALQKTGAWQEAELPASQEGYKVEPRASVMFAKI